MAASVLVFSALAAACQGFFMEPNHESTFAIFIQQHGRTYEKGSEEYSKRLKFFSQRVDKARRHNALHDRLWTAGIGPMSDSSEEELQQAKGWFGAASFVRGGRGSSGNLRAGSFLQMGPAPPEEFLNWTSLTTFKEAPNQGACGSCWAVSTALVLGAHAEIYGSSQATFSSQELVSCVPNRRHCGGSGGCDGATAELAMAYTLANGLKTDAVNSAFTKGSCDSSSSSSFLQAEGGDNLQDAGVRTASPGNAGPSFNMLGWEKLPENEYQPLLRAVAEHGPVVISVAADGWDSYSSGIFDSCSPDAVIDHAVSLIGYGGKGTSTKYWLIMNSWGSSFGENGKIRLLRKDSEQDYCGTDRQPEVGTGCDGGPSEVKVCGMCGILYDNVVPLFGKKK